MTVSIIYSNLRYKLDDKLFGSRVIQFAYSYLKFEMVFKTMNAESIGYTNVKNYAYAFLD